MANVTARLGAYDDERCVVTITYNSANGSVQSVHVVNGSALTFYWKVWLRADPTQFRDGTVAPGASFDETHLPGGVRYSPTELPPGDPSETSFDYEARVG
jgi:hypothetical protein